MKRLFFKTCLPALMLAVLCVCTGCYASPLLGILNELRTDEGHFFLQGKGIGYCETLTDEVHILFVWVDDTLSVWNETDRQAMTAELESGLEMLETQAGTHGVTLRFSQTHIDAAIDIEASDLNDAWKDSALFAAGYTSAEETQLYLEGVYEVSSAPIVFLLNRNGRPYAVSQNSIEGPETVVLYASDAYAFAHELLHLYGAEDLYLLDETVELAARLLPDSIMDEGGTIDDLTLYLIGWTDELTPDAKEFLDGTEDLTAAYIESVREKDQQTGLAKIEWSGGIYVGELLSGIPHGKGKLTYADGEYYDGEWEGGYFHGEGTYMWPDGENYVGGWKNDLKHGKGTYTWADGTVYAGDWAQNVISGNGKMTFDDGSFYEGEWKNDVFWGRGVYLWADGMRYEGDWYDGIIAGKGKMTYPDGSWYDGEWANDMCNGYGVCVWADGSRYEGNWKDDQMHGKGKMQNPDGTEQEGIWNNGTFVG